MTALRRYTCPTVKDLCSAPSRGYSPPRSNVLPSGYRRSDYHYYGATDDDIEYWGLDQPGAPAPWDAGIAVWELLDADGIHLQVHLGFEHDSVFAEWIHTFLRIDAGDDEAQPIVRAHVDRRDFVDQLTVKVRPGDHFRTA